MRHWRIYCRLPLMSPGVDARQPQLQFAINDGLFISLCIEIGFTQFDIYLTLALPAHTYRKKLLSISRKKVPSNIGKILPSELLKILPSEFRKKVLAI